MEKKLILQRKAVLHVMTIVYDCQLAMELRISSPYEVTRLRDRKKTIVFKVCFDFDKKEESMYSMIEKSLEELNMRNAL